MFVGALANEPSVSGNFFRAHSMIPYVWWHTDNMFIIICQVTWIEKNNRSTPGPCSCYPGWVNGIVYCSKNRGRDDATISTFQDQSFYCSMGFVYTSWVDVNTSSSSPQMEILHNTKFSKEPYYHTFTDTLKAGSIYWNQMLQWSRWIFSKCLKQLGLNLLWNIWMIEFSTRFYDFICIIFSNSKWPIRSGALVHV